MDDLNDNGPSQNFTRIATSEIPIPVQVNEPLPAFVLRPVKVVPAAVYAPPVYNPAPSPAPEPVAFVMTPSVGDPVISASTNLAPDNSNFYSNGESYFALAGEGGASTDWYEYPTQNGTIIFDPVGGGPQQELVGGPGVIAYGGQSLMPSTWYLNTALNGVIKIANDQPQPVPIFGAGQIYAGGNSLFYNAESLMPATWYLNPALNGEILLDDASGTQLLHSIDANLYYNNELLAKANDIQDIADWSLYPALASVDFDANSITGLADITATGAASVGTLTTTGLATLESINVTGTLAGPIGGTVDAGINTNTSGILTSGLSTNPAIAATTDSITTSQILFDICGGTLATDGGGTVLTFNGQAITTGTEGDAANWSTYPAFNDITGITTEPLVIRAPASQPLNITAPDVGINSTTGGAYNVTVDKGLNIVAAANVNITAQNGSGGNIALNAEPGYQLGNQQIGFGAIQLNAFGSSNQLLGLGGKIDINAYSGGLGEYGSATSRVSVSSATIALSAGAVPALPATAGSMNIFGQDIVSIVASLVPPILPQFPNSVFIYGDGVPGIAGGVRLSSPQGVQIAGNSDFYATDMYPFTSLGLNLKGRASIPGPAADVTIADCASIVMRSAATISDVNSLSMAGSGAITGVQTINGVVYPPPVGDVADWSTFPAKQPVDMSGNGLTNVASINTLTNASITSAGTLAIITDGADLTLAADNGGNVNVGTGNMGNINIQTAGAGHNLLMGGDVASLTGATATNIETLAGAINMVATTEISLQGPVIVGSTPTPQNITVNGGITATADVVSSQGTDNYSLNTIGALVGGIPSGFRDATEFYVSFDGNDTTGLGSILSPYRTIQKAIAVAEAISSALQVCVINVASGIYTENLTFNVGYVTLNGSLQSQNGNEVCKIAGSITINVSGPDDVFLRQVSIQGFNITCGAGQSVSDTSTAAHTVGFQDCRVFATNVFFNSTTTAADMRLYMANVEVQQTNIANTLPIISTNVGQLDFERLDMSVAGNCSAIVVGGTSILSRFSLSALETTNAAGILAPLLSFTSNTLSTHTLGNVAFAFSSATAKTNTDAVYIDSSVNTVLLMLNNVFSLLGTASSTNFTVGYNGTGSPAILGVNNTSLTIPGLAVQAVAVQSGITQIAYTDINPPVMGAYSKSADQGIPLANTPVAVVFQTTQFQQGTALATSRLQVSASGNYQVNYQVQTQASISATVTTYLAKNGTALPNTGSQFTSGTTSQAQTSPQFIITLNAGDYIELFINSNALGTIVNSTAAAAPLPAIPGAIITITQIR